MKEALLRAKDEDGLEITGKLRDIIAELMNESPTNIARMDSINNSRLLPPFLLWLSALLAAALLPRKPLLPLYFPLQTLPCGVGENPAGAKIERGAFKGKRRGRVRDHRKTAGHCPTVKKLSASSSMFSCE